jgi:hypothetical protein
VASDQVTATAPYDWGKGIFDLGDTALKGYFATQTASITAKAATKAPVGSIIAIVGGIVAVALIVFVLRK